MLHNGCPFHFACLSHGMDRRYYLMDEAEANNKLAMFCFEKQSCILCALVSLTPLKLQCGPQEEDAPYDMSRKVKQGCTSVSRGSSHFKFL